MKLKRWTSLSLAVTLSALVVYQSPLSAQSQLEAPLMTVPVAQAGVTIRIVNQTADAITYEALGDTQPRTLTATSNVTLQSLNVPTTLTIFYEDIPKDRQTGTGLLQATLTMDDASGILTMIIQPTNDLNADVSNLTVEANGSVFVF